MEKRIRLSKKSVVFILSVLIIMLISIVIIQNKQSFMKVTINNKVFNLKIANTPKQRSRGLMNVKHLKDEAGMIFIYKTPQKSYFWMKNTLIPLDIIWVNQENIIIYIQKNAQPCTQELCPSYGPLAPSKYIIEINGDLCDKYDIRVGGQIKFLR